MDEEVPPATCKHVPDNPETRNIISRALKQAEHIESRCSTCHKKGTLWCCLTCQHLGCGRRMGAHALEHAKQTQHLVALNMNRHKHGPIALYCYACNEDLMMFDDNEDDDTTYSNDNNSRNHSSNNNSHENENENENESEESSEGSSNSSNRKRRSRNENGNNNNHSSNHSRNNSGGNSRDMANQSMHHRRSQGSASEIQRGIKRGIPPTHFPPPSEWKSAQEILTSQPMWIENSYHGGTCGLANLGNTCFLNSSLQAMLHCPPIIYVLTMPEILHVGRHYNVKLIEHVVEITMAMWGGKNRYLVPKHLIRDMMILFPQFRGYAQQDAHEFLRCLLDHVHEQFSYTISTYENESENENENEKDSNNNKKKERTTKGQSPDTTRNGNENNENNGKNEKNSNDIEMKDRNNNNKRNRQTTQETNDEKSSADEKESDDSNNNNNNNNNDNNNNNNNNNKKRKEPKLKSFETTSIFQDIFGGEVVSEVECCECKNRSTTKEIIYDLSVEIPKPEQIDKAVKERDAQPLPQRGWISSVLGFVGLSSQSIPLNLCMHSYCTSEDLLQTNSYQCDKCNKKVEAKKSLHLSKLPEVLMIQIKRFSHSAFWNAGSKVSTHVEFPISNLDMKQYIHRDYINRMENKETIYDLYSIVKHSGGTGGGHYIAYAKHPATGLWYQYDDIHVTKVTPQKVQEQQAYILFYCRRRQQSHNIQSIQKILTMGNENDKKIEMSRYWFHRIVSFSRMVPIDNLWLSCYHGKPLASNHERRDICSIKVTQTAWNKLVEKFGTAYKCTMLEHNPNKNETNNNNNNNNDENNGATMNTTETKGNETANNNNNRTVIDPNAFREKQKPMFDRQPWENPISSQGCIDCDRENIQRRRNYEKNEITRLEKEGRRQDCVIPLNWANDWRDFVHGRSDIVPGCLDNRGLDNKDGMTKPGLESNTDFLLVPTPIWFFLVDLYGGGPKLNPRPNARSAEATPDIETASEDDTDMENNDHRQMRRNGAPHGGNNSHHHHNHNHNHNHNQNYNRQQQHHQQQHQHEHHQHHQQQQVARRQPPTHQAPKPQEYRNGHGHNSNNENNNSNKNENENSKGNERNENSEKNRDMKVMKGAQGHRSRRAEYEGNEKESGQRQQLPKPPNIQTQSTQSKSRNGSKSRSRSRNRKGNKVRSKSPLPSPVQQNFTFKQAQTANQVGNSGNGGNSPLPPPSRKSVKKQYNNNNNNGDTRQVIQQRG